MLKYITKILLIVFFLGFCVIISPGLSYAQGSPSPSPNVDIFEGPTNENFRQLNPLEMFRSTQRAQLSSPGGIITRILAFAFPLGGLILFTMLVWGGFEILTGAASKGIDAGRQRVTNALIGFMLLFVAYWVFQIVEFVFGVAIL